MAELHLPASAQHVVDHFFRLRIGQHEVVTPYFINEQHKKATRAWVGKGSPAEIEQATIKHLIKNQISVTDITTEQLRDEMERAEIGIDCSGFVAWVLNEMTREAVHKPIWQTLHFGGKSVKNQLRKLFRPIENINVELLTRPENATRVTDIRNIRPGDMIRSKNGKHILLVESVTTDQHDHAHGFTYAHSTKFYGQQSGMRRAEVRIIHPGATLLEQDWREVIDGRNYTWEGLNENPSDSGVLRLKALEKLISKN